ncbi:MAG: hypothetical protein ACP5J4_18885 [Anaerolineae bacterium]
MNTHPTTFNQNLMDQAMRDLRRLPGEAVQEVVDFIGYLLTKYPSSEPARGSAEALLKFCGTWEMDADESAELDAYIQMMREMPDHDRLFA